MASVDVPKSIEEATDDELQKKIEEEGLVTYRQSCKPLQVTSVMSLLRGYNTFILAATGFGKSRIPELYLKLLTKGRDASIIGVVVVLNPLDALGENQVEEKTAAGFTAINLTKLSFNDKEAKKIKEGSYNFVYISPELFLNNKQFQEVYLSPEFQVKLALVVVDEAHMIYSWGLVEDGQRHTKTLVRHQDQAAFRPCFGKLGDQLLTKHKAPLLLMSATCRPKAVEAIKASLKLVDTNINMLKGELTRPEIRIIRSTMTSSMASCEDLLRMYGPAAETPDADLVPTLVYSGTRHRTLTVMEVLNNARGSPGGHLMPGSSFARRYHSCTGELDKKDCLKDFASGLFPVVSCTLALGMGQNWKLVRQVIHMGRGDPSLICQMIGRCGRDGREGLAILFVEANRKGGKNQISDFVNGNVQTDEDRMDALAITPVCLRIAFSLDNRKGYIPLSFDDPAYKAEAMREKEAKFSPCMCSNCMAYMGETLLQNIRNLNRTNFSDYVLNKYALVAEGPVVTRRKYNVGGKEKTLSEDEETVMQALMEMLKENFEALFREKCGELGSIVASDLFGKVELEEIVKNYDKIDDKDDVRQVIHGEAIEGQLEMLANLISDFKSNPTKAICVSAPDVEPPSMTSRSTKRSISDMGVEPKRARKPRCSAEESRLRALEAEKKKLRRAEEKAIREQEQAAEARRKEARSKEIFSQIAEVKAEYARRADENNGESGNTS